MCECRRSLARERPFLPEKGMCSSEHLGYGSHLAVLRCRKRTLGSALKGRCRKLKIIEPGISRK